MAGTAERVLALKLVGDVSGIRKDLKGTERQLGKTARAAASWGKAFAGALVIKGIENVVSGLQDAYQGFRDDQQAARNLRTTWKNLGLDSRKLAAAIEDVSQKALNLGFDDADAVKAFNGFVLMTKDATQANKLLALAMDVSRDRGVDLAAAQRIVNGVYYGSARQLRLFGLEGVKGMEAVNAAADKEKGRARQWARNHPIPVLIGKVKDDLEGIAGAFVAGDFGQIAKKVGKLGKDIGKALFGFWDKSKGKKVPGLIDKAGEWGGKLADGILKGVAEFDWATGLGDAIQTAVVGLRTAGENGSVSRLAVIGTILAAGIFAATLFVDAAIAMFSIPKWSVLLVKKGAVAVLGGALGLTLRFGMFVTSKFVDAMAVMFGGIVVEGGLATALLALGGALLAGILAAFSVQNVLDWISRTFKGAAQQFGIDNGLPLGPGDVPKNPENRASGGRASGWTMLGEQGKELVNLGGGARVYPHGQSMGMAGGGVTIIMYGIAATKAEVGRALNEALSAYVQRGGRIGVR